MDQVRLASSGTPTGPACARGRSRSGSAPDGIDARAQRGFPLSRSISRRSFLVGRPLPGSRRPGLASLWCRLGNCDSMRKRFERIGRGCQFLIERARCGRRAAPHAQPQHLQDAHVAAQRDRQHVARATVWLGFTTRTRLTRILPAATSSAASVRVLAMRANQSHLSMRCAVAVDRLVRGRGAQELLLLACLTSASRRAPRAAKGESASMLARRGGAAECTSGLRCAPRAAAGRVPCRALGPFAARRGRGVRIAAALGRGRPWGLVAGVACGRGGALRRRCAGAARRRRRRRRLRRGPASLLVGAARLLRGALRAVLAARMTARAPDLLDTSVRRRGRLGRRCSGRGLVPARGSVRRSVVSRQCSVGQQRRCRRPPLVLGGELPRRPRASAAGGCCRRSRPAQPRRCRRCRRRCGAC